MFLRFALYIIIIIILMEAKKLKFKAIQRRFRLAFLYPECEGKESRGHV